MDATALKIFAQDPTMHVSVGFIFLLLPSSMPMLARLEVEVLTNLLTLDLLLTTKDLPGVKMKSPRCPCLLLFLTLVGKVPLT